jgi:long-chain acyl-CoA synthetase
VRPEEVTNSWQRAETVPQLLALRAHESPHAEAFRTEAQDGHWSPVSWHDFAAEVTRLSGALAASGLRHGDRFALIAPVSLEWELLHHAALRLGVVVIGMDAHDLPQRLADMAAQARVNAFAVSSPRVLSGLDAGQFKEVRFILRLGDMPQLETPCPQLDWNELLSTRPEGPPGGQSGFASADDDATIIFTSGTTGRPKGIPYTHRQLLLAINAICDAFSFVGKDGRSLCWLPLSNLFQRMVNLASMRNGVVTYLLDDPRRVMDVVAQASPDVFIGVPRFYEKLYEGIRQKLEAMPAPSRFVATRAWRLGDVVSRLQREGRSAPVSLRLLHAVADRLILRRIRSIMGDRLRCMVTGSAPMPLHLLTEFHALGWVVLEAYGLSENVMPMAMNRLDAFRFGTVGRPMPGNEVEISREGVVRVRGEGVFRGYLGDEAANPLDSEGFYTTGDLGRFEPDGYLRLIGRASELIKTSTGRRIAPAPIEALLRSVPGVDQAVVVGNGRKGLAALCTLTEPTLDDTPLRLALRAQLKALAEHERPLAIALLNRPFGVDTGELTPSLKVRRDVVEARHAGLIESLYSVIAEATNAEAAFIRPPEPAA